MCALGLKEQKEQSEEDNPFNDNHDNHDNRDNLTTVFPVDFSLKIKALPKNKDGLFTYKRTNRSL